MRYGLRVLWMLFCLATSALAQVSIGIGIGLPGVSIGINLPVYPQLVLVPGYPVYYAPRLQANFFFYDGLYWVYQSDHWYASAWYNGPWGLVAPEVVPVYVLRVPVRYYRNPPGYFRGWRPDAPPRWGQHWGREWEQRRSGWDQWSRRSAPAPAPLPVYQRQYSGDRYPGAEQDQRTLHSRHYRYQPRDAVVRQHYQQQAVQPRPAPDQRGQPGAKEERRPRQDDQRSSPSQRQQGAPAGARPGPPQEAGRHEQQAPMSRQKDVEHGRGALQEPKRRKGQEKERDKDDERGKDR